MKRRALLTLPLLCTLVTGCGHKVALSFVESADIGLPGEIQTVLVVNRSLPGNPGERVANAGEAWATGEGFDGDRGTSAVALDALVAVLGETDRFDLLQVRVDGKAVDTSLFDVPLDPRLAMQLCRRHDCDAVISLDSLDTDTLNQLHAVREKGEPPTFTGQTNAAIGATFRVYDGKDGQVLDQATLSSTLEEETSSKRRAEALEAFDTGESLQTELAWAVGETYGERVAPHVVTAHRGWYRTGSPAMRDGARCVRAGDWDAAASAWRTALRFGDEKVAAKARHNLAVAQEREGNLSRAQALASRAAEVLPRAKTARYAADLAERIEDESRLDKQMAGVSPRPSV